MRYLILGSVLLFLILYLSREMRNLSLPSLQALLPSWKSGSKHSLPQPIAPSTSSRRAVEDTREAMKEKTAMEEWIQSRLTQKGLVDMTESGHWQAEHASPL